MRRRWRHTLLALLLIGLCGSTTTEQQPMPLPVREQVPLFLKILSYDKNIAERGDEIVLGVLYQERYRGSLLIKNEVMAALKAFETVSNRPLRIVPIDLGSQQDLGAMMDRVGINVLYVTPLRAYNVGDLTHITRAQGLLTLTGVPTYLDSGLSVSLNVKEGRPLIMINLPASEAEGADFHSQLLKFAQVIR